jgi:hypothetical protein
VSCSLVDLTRPVYINEFVLCYLFIDHVMFGFEGLTHLTHFTGKVFNPFSPKTQN